jgi:putative hydrolases of HD superfamily
MDELQGLMKFAELMNKFRQIERTVLIAGSDRRENDVEHSFQLAMCAWYIISVDKLSLNIDLAVRYGLIHDLVEVYAGDTLAYDKNPAAHASKAGREHEALEQIKKEFSEFPELTDYIAAYEQRNDEESRFVYALDKLIAPINIYMDGGRAWKQNNITLDIHYKYKKNKIKEHPKIEEYYEQLLTLFREHQESLFHSELKSEI